MPGPTVCYFGNTTISQGFDFTFGPGVAPSICNLYTIPHVSSLPQVANLFIATVSGESTTYLTFPDCALEEPVLEVGSGGQRWRLPIKDRRWKWQSEWGPVYGHYNIIRPDATYIRERSPQQLAIILLSAMGETGYSVTQLPNNPRPEIHWDGAHAATELDQLCASLGCVVVLNPLSNAVEIWPIGQGATLPVGSTIGKASTPILQVKPEKIIVEAGPTLFQATFNLEAVGLDRDEKWRPIDSLSYRPPGGWGRANILKGFPEITGFYAKQNQRTLSLRELARATVMRCYRVSGIGLAGQWVPTGLSDPALAPQSRKDLKLYTHQADEEISPADGGTRPLPARVYGRWYTIDNEFNETLLANFQRGEMLADYPDGYQFDTDTGIITFNEPLVLFENGEIIPAVVRLETSFNAGRDGVYDRAKWTLPLNPGWTSPARIIQRPEIFNRVITRYRADAAVAVENDLADVQNKLIAYAVQAESEYAPQNGKTTRYSGTVPLSPDGLTQQITWSGGGGRGPQTVASQAQRHNRFVDNPQLQREKLLAKRIEQVEKSVIGRAANVARWGPGAI